MANIEKMKKNLARILKTMDVPKFRRADLQWLQRNLRIRNSSHEKFQEALVLIKQLIKSGA